MYPTTVLGVLVFTSLLHAGATSNVDVKLYFESKCPYCKEFITDQLWPAWKQFRTVIPSVAITLTVYPYGNTREVQVGDKIHFECQHGPEECALNMIEACGISHMGLSNVEEWLPLLVCVEKGADWKECVRSEGVDQADDFIKVVSTCAEGAEGVTLMDSFAHQSVKFDYVPWVVINGSHYAQAEANLLRTLCRLVPDSERDSAYVDLCGREQPTVTDSEM